jgi:membrane protein DedA with SNARE-associated domain
MFDQIVKFLEGAGYLGIALLMFLENLFPPLPSELIMPMAGFHAARGEQSLTLVILAGYVGSLLGALFWYYVGKWIGADRLKAWAARHGRWLTLTPRDVDRADRWFDRHCAKAVFLGRLIPTVRTLISVPAGIFAMSLPRFLIFTSLGTLLWTGLLAGAGFMLESRYEEVSHYLNPVSNIVVGLILAAYLYRVARWQPE